MNPRRGSPFFIVLQPYPRWEKRIGLAAPEKKRSGPSLRGDQLIDQGAIITGE
jgi:hypothetical protein